MQLSQYIENLNEILKINGDLEVVYSSDDEGNEYQKVSFTPTLGHFENISDHYLERLADEDLDDYDSVDLAVIIN